MTPSFCHPLRHPRGRLASLSGYSLLELLVTMGIIAVLIAMLGVVSWKKIQMKAERTSCESNLKSIYNGLSVYITDTGNWPQFPEEDDKSESGENEYWEWWHKALAEYDVTEKHWLCPTDARERKASEKDEDRDDYEGSYLPTHFGPGKDTPRTWSTQPWVIERSDFHGEGNLMIMPDGKVEASPWMKY